MSFSVCQLNDALKHASLTQLICVYLEIAAWRPWWRWVGGHCTCSTDRPTQQQQSGGSHDGQRLIRGSPEQVGFALMPQGFVKAANISAYGANTPPITYLFILSGWCVDSQGVAQNVEWTGYRCLGLIRWRTALQSTGLTSHTENWEKNNVRDGGEGWRGRRRKRRRGEEELWSMQNLTGNWTRNWTGVMSSQDSEQEYVPRLWILFPSVIYNTFASPLISNFSALHLCMSFVCIFVSGPRNKC